MASQVSTTVRVDCNGIVQTWNAQAEAIFGFGQTDMIGKSIELIIPPAYREAHWKGFARYVQTGVSALPETVVSPAIGRDGQSIRVAISVRVLRDEGGSISALEATMSPA